MAYFLFVDESGQDHKESPYEVLAGVAVEDRDLWNLVCALREAEERFFGARYTRDDGELKAKKLLKTKTFRLAAQLPFFEDEERRLLARSCLSSGANAGRREITALAQAKIGYVGEVLNICFRFRCKAFACIVEPNSPRPLLEYLRKDYAYLFERFFYFLEDVSKSASGIVVFDELEKSQSHILLGQMEQYFNHTLNGRQRAGRIIPEAFFVHSELTTGIQLADLVAYIVAWGVRLPQMTSPHRAELAPFAAQTKALMRYSLRRGREGNTRRVSSFVCIADLRGWEERKSKKAM